MYSSRKLFSCDVLPGLQYMSRQRVSAILSMKMRQPFLPVEFNTGQLLFIDKICRTYLISLDKVGDALQDEVRLKDEHDQA